MISLKKTIGAGAVAIGAFLALGTGAQAQYGVGVPTYSGPQTQIAVPNPAASMAVYTTNDLNLRIGAGTHFPAIVVMPRGSLMYVDYCEASQNWCFGNWNGIQGWASARYLSANPPYQPQPYPPYPYPTQPPIIVQPPPPPPPVIITPGPRYYGDGFNIQLYVR